MVITPTCSRTNLAPLLKRLQFSFWRMHQLDVLTSRNRTIVLSERREPASCRILFWGRAARGGRPARVQISLSIHCWLSQALSVLMWARRTRSDLESL